MTDLYQSRITKLLTYMDGRGVESAIITSPENIYYLTGYYTNPFERFLALVIRRGTNDHLLFTPSLDVGEAKEHSLGCTVIPISDTDDPYHIVKSMLPSDMSSIGLEKDRVYVSRYERLANCFPTSVFADIEPGIMALRLFKSPEEMEHVKRAVAITETALQKLLNQQVIGRTELELSAQLQYEAKVAGADKPSSPLVLSGKRTSLPHGKSSAKKIEKGDFLLIDMAVYLNGYCSDITRTVLVGEGTAEQKRIYETVLAANEKAIAAIEPGVPASKLDHIARQHIREHGYGDYFTHRLGHGMGLSIHEAPFLTGVNDEPMQAGMLFTIEPGIYVPAVGGVRIEDDVYLGQSGRPEVITTFPKQLLVI